MGEMDRNGGKWGKWREMGGVISGIAHGIWVVEGCGGMWLSKLGREWEKNGENNGRTRVRNTHFSQSLFSHVPGGRRSSPQSPLLKPAHALTNEKMGLFATPGHSLPRRLLRMLA